MVLLKTATPICGFTALFAVIMRCPHVAQTTPEKVPIGAIFTPETSHLEAAFTYTLLSHNKGYSQTKFKVYPAVARVNKNDLFEISRKFCQELSDGIFIFVAPTREPLYDTLASYTNTFQMPFLSPAFPEQSVERPSHYGVSMRPNYLRAVMDVIKHYDWKSIIYLYDSDD
ncbi:glutamate receptor 1-like, partial [Limulus polyphemus]|uniref:Glutamate receptor 1-like n=1 Tax=Limulus polyphemus TaxID=6850 RepID=A0ABM1T6Y0_LIMPO